MPDAQGQALAPPEYSCPLPALGHLHPTDKGQQFSSKFGAESICEHTGAVWRYSKD